VIEAMNPVSNSHLQQAQGSGKFQLN